MRSCQTVCSSGTIAPAAMPSTTSVTSAIDPARNARRERAERDRAEDATDAVGRDRRRVGAGASEVRLCIDGEEDGCERRDAEASGGRHREQRAKHGLADDEAHAGCEVAGVGRAAVTLSVAWDGHHDGEAGDDEGRRVDPERARCAHRGDERAADRGAGDVARVLREPREAIRPLEREVGARGEIRDES